MFTNGKQWNSEKGEWENIPQIKRKNTYGESCTDKTRYKPNVNTLTQIANFQGDLSNGNYMFTDGKDNGTRIYGLTNPGLDVTERQKWYDKIKAEGNDAKETVRGMLEEMKTQEETNEEKIDNAVGTTTNGNANA